MFDHIAEPKASANQALAHQDFARQDLDDGLSIPTLQLNRRAYQFDETEYSPTDPLAKLFNKTRPAVVQIIMDGQPHGSGFFISKDGRIATAFHCVELYKNVQVRTADNQLLSARVVERNPSKDVAYLQVAADPSRPKQDFSFLKIRETTADLKKGDPLLALGHPNEWKAIFASPATFEEISPASKSVIMPINASGRDDFLPMLKAEVHVEPGDSGGPIVDKNGEVVAMTSSGTPRSVQGVLAETIRLGLGMGMDVGGGKGIRPFYPSYLPGRLSWGAKADLLSGEAAVPALTALAGYKRPAALNLAIFGGAELVFQDMIPFAAAIESGTTAEKAAWAANIAGDVMMLSAPLWRRSALGLAIGLTGVGIKLANQVLDERRFL